eukprot:TRINITY_DN57355_c0_g1_i1.p1 TRINITY_DN57355_c0_g1~~TRINITY_DN57355_c0_g1_i1.p1  ORF type:complete len:240 (+),score=81.92 TRINITY_DN57355_c0_g1_i1:145-864(+)
MEADHTDVAANANMEVAELALQRNSLRSELEALTAALAQASSELTARIKANDGLETQVRHLQSELKVIRGERDQAIEGHEDLKAKSDATFLELQHRSELCEELTSHRRGDAQTLAQAREEIQYLNDLIAQLSGHNNTKQKIQRVQKIEADNVSLRKQNLELRNQIRKYTLQLQPAGGAETVEAVAEEVLRANAAELELVRGLDDMSVDHCKICLLYTSDAADEEDSVDIWGRPTAKIKM